MMNPRPAGTGIAWLIVSIIFLFLFITNSYHRIFPLSYRQSLSPGLDSYAATLQQLDQAQTQIARREFVELATTEYLAASAYEWPETLTRISYTDNWILWLASFTDPLLHMLDLQDRQNRVFRNFESFKYERALGRGFGICSQQALGLADLLTSRYDIPTRMVGLDGHVITEVMIDETTSVLADPSVGIVLPFAYTSINDNLDQIKTSYAATPYPELADTYDASGNILSAYTGARAYAEPPIKQELIRWFEQVTDVLSILISLVLSVTGFYRFRMTRNALTA